MKPGHRYELRSLSSKRMSPSEDSRQLHSPTKHVKKKQNAVPLIKGGFGISSEESEFMSRLRGKPYKVGDEDVDEGSERSAESFATKAVDHYKIVTDLELVDAGPLAAGNICGGRILHLNYKAKNKDVPGAVVPTFFSEMTITKKDGFKVVRNICLGPSDSLPEKADNNGCLYCLSHNIHHPKCIYAFRTGRLQFWKTLCSEVTQINNYIREGMEEENFSPNFQHPGVVFNRKKNHTTTDYATAALHMFNVEQGTDFEVVKIGPCAAKWMKKVLSII